MCKGMTRGHHSRNTRKQRRSRNQNILCVKNLNWAGTKQVTGSQKSFLQQDVWEKKKMNT